MFNLKIASCFAALAVSGAALAQYTAQSMFMPSGLSYATVNGAFEGQVAGTGNGHALLWNGTSNNLIDLDPGVYGSQAFSVSGSIQAGANSYNRTSGHGKYFYYYHACMWKGASNTFVSLDNTPGTFSYAYATNGTYEGGVMNGYATLWKGSAASAINLNPSGSTASAILGMDSKHEVGYAYVSGYIHPMLWTGTSATPVDLDPFPGTTSQSEATCVDDAHGIQAGYYESLTTYLMRAYLWKGTAASAVNLSPAGSTQSVVLAARNGKQAGYARFGYEQHAAVWSGTAASFIDLTPTALSAEATGIDSNGDVVGYTSSNGLPVPVRWHVSATGVVTVTQTVTGGYHGWNTSAVGLEISSPFTTGTPTIAYSVNGATPITVPGSSTTVTLSQSTTYEVTVTASNGKVRTTPQLCTVDIDFLPPVTTYTYVQNLLTLTASDSESGLGTLNFTLDGVTYQKSASPFSTLLTNVPHAFSYWSVDHAGNTETTHNTTLPALSPVISSLSVTTLLTGSPQFTLTVTGWGYLSTSVVNWGATALATTYGSSTSLTATVPASLLTSPGVIPITVFNPAPGAGSSAAVNFTLLQQADAAGSLSNVGEDGSGSFDISPVNRYSGFTLSGGTLHVVLTPTTAYYGQAGNETQFFDIAEDGMSVSVVGSYSNGTLTAWSVSLG